MREQRPAGLDGQGWLHWRAPRRAIGELRKADDWGLKAAAFDVPSLPEGPATAEALADAEIKLGLAVLKYGRHARGGRLDPPRSAACSTRSRSSTTPRP